MKSSSHPDQPLLTCTEADNWLSVRVDGEGLPADVEIQVDSHLDACPSCRERHEADRKRSAFLFDILHGDILHGGIPQRVSPNNPDTTSEASPPPSDAEPPPRTDEKLAAIITKALLAEGFDSVPVAAPRGIKKWATIRAWRPLLTRAAAIVLIAFGAVYWVERALDLREPRDPTNALRGTILGPGGTPGRTVLTDVGGVQVEVEEDFSNPRVVPDRDGLLWREGQRREMIWFRPVHVPGVDKSKRGPQIRMGMERVERYYRPVGNFYR